MSVHEPRAWSYNCKKAVIHVVCTSVGYRYSRLPCEVCVVRCAPRAEDRIDPRTRHMTRQRHRQPAAASARLWRVLEGFVEGI